MDGKLIKIIILFIIVVTLSLFVIGDIDEDNVKDPVKGSSNLKYLIYGGIALIAYRAYKDYKPKEQNKKKKIERNIIWKK